MKAAIYTALLSFLLISILLGAVGLAFGRSIGDRPEYAGGHAGHGNGIPEYLFHRSALSLHVQRAVIHIQRTREIKDTPLPFLIFFVALQHSSGLDFGNAGASVHMGIAGVAWATLIASGICPFVLLFCPNPSISKRLEVMLLEELLP